MRIDAGLGICEHGINGTVVCWREDGRAGLVASGRGELQRWHFVSLGVVKGKKMGEFWD